METTYFNNDNNNFIGGALLTLIFGGLGTFLHDASLHITSPYALHFGLNVCKAFCYFGSGLIGITTFLKFIYHIKGHKKDDELK